MHQPPFKAHITGGGYFLNLDSINTERSKIPKIMCDLLLKKLYPGEHNEVSDECVSFQFQGKSTVDNSFDEKYRKYKLKIKDNFGKRKLRKNSEEFKTDSLVEYNEAIDFKPIAGSENTDWSSVLLNLLNMNKLRVEFKIEFDGTKAVGIKRLVSKFDIFDKNQINISKSIKDKKPKQIPILSVSGEQVRETANIDKVDLKNLMAKHVIQKLEWHGLILEGIDYKNWDVEMSVLRQAVFRNERQLRRLKNKDTDEEVIDEEWDNDLEFMADENSKNGSNFYFNFRKNGTERQPVLKDITPNESFEYRAPYKVANCFLDYPTWRDTGFDGKRDPLVKRKLRMMEDNRQFKPLGGIKRGLPGQNIYGGAASTAQQLGGTASSMYQTTKQKNRANYDPFDAIARGHRQSTNFQPNYAYEQQSDRVDERRRVEDKAKLDAYYARLAAKQQAQRDKRRHTEDHKEEIIFKQHIENLPKLLSIRDNFKGPSMYRDQDSKHSQSGPLIGNRHGF